MKKENKKGFTLVEIIVTSVIGLVVAGFLIAITIKMVNKNNDYYKESQLLADKTIITKEIMDDINNPELKLISIVVRDNTVEYSFKKIDDLSEQKKITKTLEIIDNIDGTTTVKYDNFTRKLSKEGFIQSLTAFAKCSEGEMDIDGNCPNKEASIDIELPIYTNYSDEDYGIKINIPYKTDEVVVKIPTKNQDEGISYCEATKNKMLKIELNTTQTPDFSKTSCSSGCEEDTVGVFTAEDDFGTSCYIRGDVENNYVKFGKYNKDIWQKYIINTKTATYTSSCKANGYKEICTKIASTGDDMYWRIIRINGDGTIRMIYDGTKPRQNGEMSINGIIGLSSYNLSYTDNAYVGYMYGKTGATNYSEAHLNINNSTIKTYIDIWYENNLKNTIFEDYIADAIYCNDREVYFGTGAGIKETSYAAIKRLKQTIPSPDLRCKNLNDRFTKDKNINEEEGNDMLKYPVALITADEIAFAGGKFWDSNNSMFYLYNGRRYWTMTPGEFTYSEYQGTSFVTLFSVLNNGLLTKSGAYSDGIGVVPVLTIKANSINSGEGTKDNPYYISI